MIDNSKIILIIGLTMILGIIVFLLNKYTLTRIVDKRLSNYQNDLISKQYKELKIYINK